MGVVRKGGDPPEGRAQKKAFKATRDIGENKREGKCEGWFKKLSQKKRTNPVGSKFQDLQRRGTAHIWGVFRKAKNRKFTMKQIRKMAATTKGRKTNEIMGGEA